MKQADVLQLTGVEKNQYTKDHEAKLAAIYNLFKEEKTNVTSVTTEPMRVWFGKKTKKEYRNQEWHTDVINKGTEMDGYRIIVNTDRGQYWADVPTGKLYKEFCTLLGIEQAEKPAAKIIQSILLPNEFVNVLKRAAAFVSKDRLRPAVRQVSIEIVDNYAQVIATDCHRLFMSEPIACIGPSGGNYTFLIKGTDVKKLPKWPLMLSFNLNVLEGNKISIGDHVFDLFTEAKYVDWRCMVRKYETGITFNRENFMEKLKEVLPFTNRTTSQINIAVSNDIFIHGQDVDFSFESSGRLTYLKNSVGTMAIAFNGDFVMEILKSFKSKEITLLTAGEDKRAGIFTDGQDQILCMPLQLLNDDNSWLYELAGITPQPVPAAPIPQKSAPKLTKKQPKSATNTTLNP